MKKRTLLTMVIFYLLLHGPNYVHAQGYQNPYGSYTPGSYNNYKREQDNAARAAKELQRSHYSPSSSGKTNSNPVINSTPSYFYVGLRAEEERRKRDKEAYDKKNEERAATYNNAAAKWKAEMLARGRARTAEDHYDLMLLGLRKGYNESVVIDVIGRDIAGYTSMYGSEGPSFRKTNGKEDKADASLSLMAMSNEIGVKAYLFKDVIDGYPNAGNYGTMGVYQMELHNYEEAVKNFQNAIKLDNTNGAFKSGYAAALAFADKLPEAEVVYKEVIVQEPSAFSEINLAWVLMRQGKEAEALKHATLASKSDPNEVGAILAQAALETEALKAKQLSDTALAILPDIGTGNIASRLFKYAKLLHSAKDYYSSILFLDLAIKAEPENIDFVELRYGTNMLLKRQKLAAADAETLSKL